MIPAQEACKVLDITDSALCTSAKYKPYYSKTTKGKRNAMFDIKGYLKMQELQQALVAQVGLLIEYLNKIEDMTYENMSDVTKVNLPQLHTGIFGFETALKIARAIKVHKTFHWIRYHKYYGYNI